MGEPGGTRYTRSTDKRDITISDMDLDFSDVVIMQREQDVGEGNSRSNGPVIQTVGHGSRLLASVHILFCIVSTALIFDAVTSCWDTGDRTICITMATFLIACHVIGNFISLLFIYRQMDFTGKQTGKCVCVVMHLLLLGPIWRFLRIALSGDIADIMELNFIRLIMSTVGDIPFIVIQTSVIIEQKDDISVVQLVSVMVVLLSACSAISTHNLMMEDTRQKPDGHRALIYWTRLAVFIGSSLLLTSRCLILALFLIAWGHWMALFLIGHLLLIIIILYITNEFSKNKRPVNLKVGAAWAGQCIEWLELDVRATKWDFVAFYATVGVENMATAVSSVVYNGFSSTDTIIGAIGALCFIIGLFFKILTFITCPFVDKDGSVQSSVKCSPPAESLYKISRAHSDKKLVKQRANVGSPLRQGILQSYANFAFASDNSEELNIDINHQSIIGFDTECQDDSGFVSKADETPERLLHRPIKTSLHNKHHLAQVHAPFDTNTTVEYDCSPDISAVSNAPLSSTPQKTRHYRTQEICIHRGYNMAASNIDESKTLSLSLHPPKHILSSISSHSSLSCTHCTCTDTFCEVCHCAWAQMTSSSDLDSLSDLLRGDLDLDIAMTWPPSRKFTIENLSNLPTHILSCQEHVLTWLSKSLGENMNN